MTKLELLCNFSAIHLMTSVKAPTQKYEFQSAFISGFLAAESNRYEIEIAASVMAVVHFCARG
jgi:hypothetical protein